MSTPARKLTWQDCDQVFADLHAADLKPIVVGGQAINLWLDYYSQGPTSFGAPIASKDIDVVGGADFANACASALNARCQTVNRVKAAVPMNAIVFLGDDEDALKIDFLDGADPNTPNDIEIAAVLLPTAWGEVRVMHPLHCVKSRIYNVLEIRLKGVLKYDNEHGIAQMHAAMKVFRRFTKELAGADGGPRKVLRVFEEIFVFSKGALGKKLWDAKRIDVFSECVQPLPELPKNFRTVRYPQMIAALGRQ